MVKLVQTLEMLPTCDLATQPMIQFHFAFALNRWNSFFTISMSVGGDVFFKIPVFVQEEQSRR